MSADDVRRWLRLLAERFEAEREKLGALDARAGDGDHGAAMARGFAAARSAVDGATREGTVAAVRARPVPDGDAAAASLGDDVGELLLGAGRAFMAATGGASGPLVASVLLELGKHARGSTVLDASVLADGLADAVALVKRMGRAETGDKTLLDALAPAAEAADAHRRDALGDALAAVSAAADEGRDATSDLPARKGRARWVEGAGEGHVDAGATTIALVLTLLADVAREGRPA